MRQGLGISERRIWMEDSYGEGKPTRRRSHNVKKESQIESK